MRRLSRLAFTILILSAFIAAAAQAAAPPRLTLELQRRDPATGKPMITPATIDPAHTGIVLVDLWNEHHCLTARQRIGALIPRINRALEAARGLGMQVIWAPTDVAEMYVGAPQREAAAALPVHPLPPPLKIEMPDPRGGGCMCGPGIICGNHWGWDGMNPDLMIDARDLIVGSGSHDADRRSERLYAICKERGLEQLIYMGVHENMCVLNKSVGMRPMAASGIKVILARDMTDALTEYDPERGYTPDDGTAEVAAHYEKYFCPTIEMACELRKAGLWPDAPAVDPVRFAPWGVPDHPYLFENSIQVTLSFPTTTGAEIRYSIDGSVPSANSTLYQKPVPVSRTCQLRAAAFKDGRCVSIPSATTYTKLAPAPPLPEIRVGALKPLHQATAYNLEGAEGNPPPPRADRSITGGELTLRGVKYEQGVGVNTPSHLMYELRPEYKRFVARAGVDEAMLGVNHARARAKYPSVVFRVFIDGKLAAESPVMRVGQEPWRFDVRLPAGGRTISLATTDAGDGNRYDLAQWVNAGFVCSE